MELIVDKVRGQAVNLIAFCIGLFHLLEVAGLLADFGFNFSTQDIRIIHLLMMLALLFLTRATLKKLSDNLLDKVFGIALTLVSVGACLYLLSRWKNLALGLESSGPVDIWVGLLLIILVLEAARRGVGIRQQGGIEHEVGHSCSMAGNGRLCTTATRFVARVRAT